jgi:3-methyladenine DNA glycosylase AlkD
MAKITITYDQMREIENKITEQDETIQALREINKQKFSYLSNETARKIGLKQGTYTSDEYCKQLMNKINKLNNQNFFEWLWLKIK